MGLVKIYSCLQQKHIFVHIFMAMGVAVYTLFGGFVLQKLEKKPTNMTSVKGMAKRNMFAENYYTYENRHGENSNNAQKIRMCVKEKIKAMMNKNCPKTLPSMENAIRVEECYQHSKGIQFSEYDTYYNKNLNKPWTFMDSLMFTFTIITTIGYGYVAPQTFWGRLFCMFYGFVGIPLTVIALADLGKFISELMDRCEEKLKNILSSIRIKMKRRKRNKWRFEVYGHSDHTSEETIQLKDFDDSDEKEVKKSTKTQKSVIRKRLDDIYQHKKAIQFLILFVIYLFCGALMISYYEPDMDFFKAFYFNFVSLTSIGLGDVYPRNDAYILITITYISIGLILCTIAFDIAANYLRKLHYFGRKIEKVGRVVIWFGGKRLTMKQLVKNLAAQFNLPHTAIKSLDIDKFVEDAIKVENGELDTLRTNPLGPEHVHIELEPYADEDERGDLKWSFRIKFREN